MSSEQYIYLLCVTHFSEQLICRLFLLLQYRQSAFSWHFKMNCKYHDTISDTDIFGWKSNIYFIGLSSFNIHHYWNVHNYSIKKTSCKDSLVASYMYITHAKIYKLTIINSTDTLPIHLTYMCTLYTIWHYMYINHFMTPFIN